MEAIILAGGFGTRLSHIISDVPKPMAPIEEQPFLKFIFDYLLRNEIKHVILAIGYKADIIQKYFGFNYQGINISYSIENIPLGTGGAIKKALNYSKEENVFVINGDTYFDVDLRKMQVFHTKKNSRLTLAVKHMNSFDRYGSVLVEKDIIKRFKEKKAIQEGTINGGIYLINSTVISLINKEVFSFEKEVLESGLVEIYAFESDGYFIDIGIPEDYYKALNELKNI